MEIIKSLKDSEYPKAALYNARIAARGVCLNAKGEIALTHILATDKFGHRDYYELPGGGKRINETVLESAIREMDEELGVKVELLAKIGIIHDFYNLIKQENYCIIIFKVTGYSVTLNISALLINCLSHTKAILLKRTTKKQSWFVSSARNRQF